MYLRDVRVAADGSEVDGARDERAVVEAVQDGVVAPGRERGATEEHHGGGEESPD